ncbi:piRNA biogenesis protein EXD1 isoform X2 [Hetaerina americana]
MDPVASAWLTPGTEIVGNKNTSIMRGVQAPSAVRVPFARRGNNDMPRDMYKYYQNLMQNLKVIDEVGNNFDEAVAEIMSHSIVGVSAEGTLLGRRGKLSWINVCCPELTGVKEESIQSLNCPSHVKLYLFDVALMGAAAFSKGLRSFLEEEDSPRKVIHDCRLFSDCLYHQFDIKLQNVLDTQVADSLVNFPRMRPAEERGLEKLVFARSLNSCLGYTLGLPRDLTYQANINDGFLQKSLEIWYQRPLTALMAKAMTFQSIYLIHLWNKLLKAESLSAFRLGVEIYLSCVRDVDDDTAFLMANYYNLVPDEFIPILMNYHHQQRQTRSSYGKKQSARVVKE